MCMILFNGVFVVNTGKQTFIRNVQQRHPRSLVNTTAFRFDDTVFNLIAHAQTVTTADAVSFQHHFYVVAKGFTVQRHRMTLLKAYCDFFCRDLHALIPELHAHNRVDDFDAGVEVFQILRFMRCTKHVGVRGVSFFDRHFVVETAGNHKFRHFMTTAQFINKVSIKPRFVNLQFSIGQQTVTIETFDIVSFIGAAVTPDIHAIFFHSSNQHGASHGAAQRRRVEIGQATGGVMKCATLNSGNTFGNQLFAAVDQTCVLRAVFHGTTRDRIIILFVWLAQVCSICIRNRSLLSHPQQCGTGVQTAGKSDTNTLTYREMLENRRHKITPCLIN